MHNKMMMMIMMLLLMMMIQCLFSDNTLWKCNPVVLIAFSVHITMFIFHRSGTIA